MLVFAVMNILVILNSLDIKIFNKQMDFMPEGPDYPGCNTKQMDTYVCTMSNECMMIEKMKNDVYIYKNINNPAM